MVMGLGYYYRDQAEQFSFIRIPKAIVKEEIFAPLSIQAKILYGLLLDKMSGSMKNRWLDDQNRAFIVYPVTEISEDLGVSKKKAIESLTELENIGLIEKKQRGQGKPNIIYVKNFASHQKMSEV